MTDAEFIEDIADLLDTTMGTKYHARLMEIASDLRDFKTGGTTAHMRQKSEELARSRTEVRRLKGLLRDSNIRLVAVIERIQKELVKHG